MAAGISMSPGNDAEQAAAKGIRDWARAESARRGKDLNFYARCCGGYAGYCEGDNAEPASRHDHKSYARSCEGYGYKPLPLWPILVGVLVLGLIGLSTCEPVSLPTLGAFANNHPIVMTFIIAAVGGFLGSAAIPIQPLD